MSVDSNSHNTNDESELKKDVEKVNPQAIEETLENAQSSMSAEQSQSLGKEEETPFIDDSLRTDENGK